MLLDHIALEYSDFYILGSLPFMINSLVVLAEWVAHLWADREITHSNPSILPHAEHVGNTMGCYSGCQEVSRCCTRGESEEQCADRKDLVSHPGFETQNRCHQKSKTGVPVAHKKDMCPPFFLKKSGFTLVKLMEVIGPFNGATYTSVLKFW